MVNEVIDGENKCPLLWNIVTSTSRGGRLVGVGKEVLTQHLLWRLSLLPMRIRGGTKCQSLWDSSQKHHQKTSSLSFIASWQNCFISTPPADALNNLNRYTRSGDRNNSDALFPMSAITPSGEREYLFLMTYPPTQLRVKCRCNSRIYLLQVSHDVSHTF